MGAGAVIVEHTPVEKLSGFDPVVVSPARCPFVSRMVAWVARFALGWRPRALAFRPSRRLLEERIRQRTAELEAAVERATGASLAKSEFLANVSHELRTPMNGVIGMIEVVLDGRVTTEQREQLETALRCAYSLLAIVNDIFDVSKIDAGKLVLEKIPFGVRQLMEECVEPHRKAAAAKGISLGCSVDSTVPSMVTGDPLRIRQIVANLLDNAVKFTDRGEVMVQVSATAAIEGTVELRVDVTDTGSGIVADMLPFIFDKFTQADATISRQHGGTGLGLAIARQLAQMHGGSVEVESTVGQGSRFTVHLLCESETPAVAALAGEEQGDVAAQTRILVVEDNIINQKVVTAILRKKGYQTVVANDGREALELLRKAPARNHFAMVLMDVQMPVMDGLEATRAIRSEPFWIDFPIIAMTAHAMVGDRDRCLQAGMSAYVSKPVNPAHLIATVERYARQGTRPERAAAAAVGQSYDSGHREPAITAGSDAALAEGMIQVFLQLAPERLARLSSAAQELDTTKLVEETRNMAGAAQRIAAGGVSECTREIAEAASTGDYDRVHEQLARLSDQISALQQRVPAA